MLTLSFSSFAQDRRFKLGTGISPAPLIGLGMRIETKLAKSDKEKAFIAQLGMECSRMTGSPPGDREAGYPSGCSPLSGN